VADASLPLPDGADRQAKSRPVVEALVPWVRVKLGFISQKSKLAEAIR
jgi:hypothetical protein